MHIKEYGEKAFQTALYAGKGRGEIFYICLKLAEEIGEFNGKIGKLMRVKQATYLQAQDIPDSKPLLYELGDILWYVNAAAIELGTTLEEIAQLNLDKLQSRQERGVIIGNGDER